MLPQTNSGKTGKNDESNCLKMLGKPPIPMAYHHISSLSRLNLLLAGKDRFGAEPFRGRDQQLCIMNSKLVAETLDTDFVSKKYA
jgi:hypothetical protein